MVEAAPVMPVQPTCTLPDRLNAAPFNCDLSLVGFDEKAGEVFGSLLLVALALSTSRRVRVSA